MSFQFTQINEFIDVLASKAAVPGGGGASALVGAVGIALGNMVGSLTVGKKKYADVEADIIELQAKAGALQAELLRLMDADAEAFEPLSKAYGIPKDDPTREKVMEDALRVATAVPLEIMRTCAKAIGVISEFAAKGSTLAISDAGVGAVFARAAMYGAWFNVMINTKAMTDRAYAEKINLEFGELLADGMIKADQISDAVYAKLR
jgi:formiminotetrahydrofolate cyclodeaminase